MADTTKSYRIRTDIGSKLPDDYITVDANLVQDYDAFDILSVSIDSVDTYKLHNSNYGVVVGRVLANNGFGIPNAKISIFISSDGEDGEKVRKLYPYTSSAGKDSDGVRYNLLPDEQVNDCHQVVGTFPNKRYALDNDVVLEVFDKYYKYTTRTNNAGDYLIMGVPTGAQTIHMDLDLSDCGILSQRPRDFVYKGYTIEQFENANMFKDGTNYPTLSQIFTQDQVVNVRPFWGNSSLGEELGITRADIDVAFTFEPTCVFIGSVVSDNSSQGITKKCMGTENMGNMEELVTGEGTIEMIRMTPAGNVEEFQIKGTQLIDGDGVWCYQIPMNLDYMMTDEYGNMVPTDDPSKGVATRTRVRFRISMQDNEENVDNFFRPKVLVPHNPQNTEDGGHEDYDYEFGTFTREDSFRDLFWNNVYSVKSYIPRFQKRKIRGWKDKRFVGIKNCNFYGTNNPIPYNNIRIRLPFMFTVMCAIIKAFIFIVGIFNSLVCILGDVLASIGTINIWDILSFGLTKLFNINLNSGYIFNNVYDKALGLYMTVLMEGLCPDLENWYFAPVFSNPVWSPDRVPPGRARYNIFQQTLSSLQQRETTDGASTPYDPQSIDYNNSDENDEGICLTTKTDYLLSCVEMNLAMEYRVINFDFYNDWLNGTIYIPRFMRYVRPKKKFLGITVAKTKIKGCMDDPSIFSKTRRYTQQCALNFRSQVTDGYSTYSGVKSPMSNSSKAKTMNQYHKSSGFRQKTIFGSNGGITHEKITMIGDSVYYMKPCEWTYNTNPSNIKVNLFATDIILLGSLNTCDSNGLPQSFKYLSSTSYVLPPNLALTNMEENGPLYANGRDTICTTNSESGHDSESANQPIKVISQNEGISGELVYFSGGNATDIDLNYDTLELSDYIALTEVAGISWNFTGPNQGTANDATMFTPGGHFLGLSCVNSQTNIKSCINLSRICEVGVNMSQRKEDISSVSENNGTSELHYTYTAPSGFISGDDIVGESFRSMFATMNQNRLLATRTNPDTGYKVYDFTFMKPINFNGSFSQVATTRAPYNQEIPIAISEDQKNVLRSVGIAVPGDTGVNAPDWDAAELDNTQIRTIEDASVDYYAFRMGLKHSQLVKGDSNQNRKFLLSTGGEYYLPQYENSYYFYFGLNAGSTAIEKFNTQFFATCAAGNLLQAEPSMTLSVHDIDICSGIGSVNVVLNNLATPYQLITYYREGDNYLVAIKNNSDPEDLLNSFSFVRSGLTLGNYTFQVTDANDVVMEQDINLGDGLVNYNLMMHDFNCIAGTSMNYDDDIYFRGGYLEVSNINIPLLSTDMDLQLEVHTAPIGDYTLEAASEPFKNDGQTVVNVKCVRANVTQYLYVTYTCEGGSKQSILLQTFKLSDTSLIKLSMGVKNAFEIPLSALTHSFMDWWFSDTEYGNFTENQKWFTKYCLTNEINSSALGSTTFSTNIICENGTKVIWGTPQTTEGFYEDGYDSKGDPLFATYSSEEYENLPEGTTLDDGYSYYSTVWYEKQGRKFPNEENRPRHFSVLAYNGQLVYGDYYAKWSVGENGEPSVEFITSYAQDFFHNGYGYIFKPLPEGDLEFMTLSYEESSNEATDLARKLEALSEMHVDYEGTPYEYGLLYPSFIIPVFSRPFYANANFYVWEKYGWTSSDDGSNRTKYLEDRCGRTELTIYNGVTWPSNGEYRLGDFRSYATNISNLTGLKTSLDDLYYLKNGQNTPREIIISGITSLGSEQDAIEPGVTGVTAGEYEIYWGTPEDETWSGYSYANSISEYAPFMFYSETLSGTVHTDETIGKKVITFNPPEAEDGHEFYICAQSFPMSNGNFVYTDKLIRFPSWVSTWNYYYQEYNMGDDTAFRYRPKLAKYYINSVGYWEAGDWWGLNYMDFRNYDIELYAEDRNNKLVRLAQRLVEVHRQRGWKFERWAFYWWVYDGSSGNLIYSDEDDEGKRDTTETKSNYYKSREGQIEILINRFPEYTIVMEPRIPNMTLNRNWRDIIERDRRFAENNMQGDRMVYDENLIYYAVEEYKSNSANKTIDSISTLYKIYPYFYLIDRESIVTDIIVTPSIIVFNYIGVEFPPSGMTEEEYVPPTISPDDIQTFVVNGSMFSQTRANIDDIRACSDWVSISPTEGYNGFTVSAMVATNTSYVERTAVISFSGTDGGKSGTITIVQSGAPYEITTNGAYGDLTDTGYPGQSIRGDEGMIYQFDIMSLSGTQWAITKISGSTWMDVSPMSGNAATTSVRVTFSENSTGNPRTGIIRISAVGKPGHRTYDIKFIQNSI